MDTKEKYRSFLENFTDFIFVEDEPEQADMIFVPGNGYPQDGRTGGRIVERRVCSIHSALWKI